ncbi:MAG: PrsW family glutamic-type intramembrane protease [Clostridiaceae bacterium]|nr:PrsW family glutamic-type intramembrane protease [Clostridiaceae bacterium]
MTFFMPPIAIVPYIYILAAVLPAVFLLFYIYRQDNVEKEPFSLLLVLIVLGVVSALCSLVLEGMGKKILDSMIDRSSPFHTIAMAYIVVAAVEEGTKFYFLYRRTWLSPAFNYRFDGIVYSVFISLGFAAFENISYVMSYGLAVALPRALLAVPGHMGFAVFMGLFYGRAKLCERRSNRKKKRLNLIIGYLSAVALHGYYDACAMIGGTGATVLFVIFVLMMYLFVFKLIKNQAQTDEPV